MPISPTYLHKRGHYLLYSCLCDSSAGPGLYSQGTWGQARLSRGRAMGIRVSTFQCSLRPGPAAALCSAGPVSLRRSGGSMGVGCEGFAGGCGGWGGWILAGLGSGSESGFFQ